MMAVSVRMNPLLEHELEVAARQQGKTKSQFIIDAVERALGRTDPYELFVEVKAAEERGEYGPQGDSGASQVPNDKQSRREHIRAELRAKHGADDAHR